MWHKRIGQAADAAVLPLQAAAMTDWIQSGMQYKIGILAPAVTVIGERIAKRLRTSLARPYEQEGKLASLKVVPSSSETYMMTDDDTFSSALSFRLLPLGW